MRLLIDTNIILDVLQKREPHYKASSIIWKLCEVKKVEGCVSTLTFANIMYILRKELTSEQIRETLKALSLIFDFTDLTPGILQCAAELEMKDFEDAIQTATAKKINADYIISRNIKDFTASDIAAYTPSEFLERFEM